MKTPNIELAELAQSESVAYVNLNDAFRALDTIVQLTVESRSVATPPSAEQGARYIVPSGPTGAWVGHAKHVAFMTVSGWSFRTPRKGWTAFVLDEDTDEVQKHAVYFDGVDWVDLIYANGIGHLVVREIGSPSATFTDITALEFSGGLQVDQVDVNTVRVTVFGEGGSSSGSTNVNADTHPLVANVADDEFEDGSTLDTSGSRFSGALSWAWVNQTGASAALLYGSLVLTGSTTTSSTNNNLVMQSISGSTYKYTAKLALSKSVNNAGAYIALRNSANSRLIVFGFANVSGAANIYVQRLTNPTTFSANQYLVASGLPVLPGISIPAIYFQIENDGTNLIFRHSFMGVSFTQIYTETVAAFLGTPTDAGLGVNSVSTSTAAVGVIDWFRRG